MKIWLWFQKRISTHCVPLVACCVILWKCYSNVSNVFLLGPFKNVGMYVDRGWIRWFDELGNNNYGVYTYWEKILDEIKLARTYLQLPFRQWGAGNVYLLVLFSWNIAENPIVIMGLLIRSGLVSYCEWEYYLKYLKIVKHLVSAGFPLLK